MVTIKSFQQQKEISLKKRLSLFELYETPGSSHAYIASPTLSNQNIGIVLTFLVEFIEVERRETSLEISLFSDTLLK